MLLEDKNNVINITLPKSEQISSQNTYFKNCFIGEVVVDIEIFKTF